MKIPTLELTPLEVYVLAQVLDTVNECVDVVGLDVWSPAVTGQEFVFNSLKEKVNDVNNINRKIAGVNIAKAFREAHPERYENE